jgi:hypothetical protein
MRQASGAIGDESIVAAGKVFERPSSVRSLCSDIASYTRDAKSSMSSSPQPRLELVKSSAHLFMMRTFQSQIIIRYAILESQVIGWDCCSIFYTSTLIILSFDRLRSATFNPSQWQNKVRLPPFFWSRFAVCNFFSSSPLPPLITADHHYSFLYLPLSQSYSLSYLNYLNNKSPHSFCRLTNIDLERHRRSFSILLNNQSTNQLKKHQKWSVRLQLHDSLPLVAQLVSLDNITDIL